MTNKKPNDVRVVPVELLEELLDAAKWKAADFTKASPYRSKIDEVVRRTKDLLTQPADQQGEPFFYALCGPDGKPHYDDFCVADEAHQLECEEEGVTVVPLYRHAQPATAKVDEDAEFEIWRNDQIESLERMGCQDAAKAFRNLGSVHWTGWQARANLNGGKS